MQTIDQRHASGVPPAHELPRLLPPVRTDRLEEHLAHFGPRPRGARALVGEIERAGLRGHGGAGFPTATKMAAILSGKRRRYVVVNATEGEPMSAKDKVLCSLTPHLVLDGAALAAETIRADEIVVCVDRTATSMFQTLRRAVDERARAGTDRVVFRLEAAPHRYVSGEESALVRWLNGQDAKPTFTPPRPVERGVAGRPTLVQNAETLAHVALIARYGATWYRALGTAQDPGSTLVTVTGAVANPNVYEIPLGAPLEHVLVSAGGSLDRISAVLIGGYFGTWIRAVDVPGVTVDPSSLRSVGASLGCGVIVALPRESCGLVESTRVAHWLARENAGQCGPCVHGLPAIAAAMNALVRGDRDRRAEAQLRALVELVKGRGVCKHPDGAARFVMSSLDAFADEIDAHRRGACRHSATEPVLQTPAPGGWR